AVRLPDRRFAARVRPAGDRDRPRRGRASADDPRHGRRHDPRRAGREPGDHRPQRLGRVPEEPVGRGPGEGRRLAHRPVRRRLLLRLHDRRPGPRPHPQLPRRARLGVGLRRHRPVHRRARGGPPAPRDRDHPPPQGGREGLHLHVPHQGRRPALFELRPPPDQARRRGRSHQRPEADLGRAQAPGDRGAVRALLPAPEPPPRREAPLAPSRLALRIPPAGARRQPLRQAGARAERLPRAAAGLPAIPVRPGRLRRPAPERLARDAPGQHGDPPDPGLPAEVGVRPHRPARQGPARGLPDLHRAGRHAAQGRRDRRRPPARSAGEAHPVRVVAQGRRQARRLPRRLRLADARGPEADLLPRRPRPRRDREEPEPGSLPQAEDRGALPHRADRRVRHQRPRPVRRQAPDLDRLRRPGPARGGRRGVEGRDAR
ncbi:hypothetical protein HK102_010145, partial [Quaeritorhiza haematococci]